MHDVYIIVNRRTGAAVHKAYLNVRDAKLALKCHYGTRLGEYAVAKISGVASVFYNADANGKWTEVSAE